MRLELIKRVISSIILIPVSLIIIINGGLIFNLFIIIMFLISIYEWNNISPNNFSRISGLLFILISFYSVYKIRNIYDGEYIYFIFVLIICVFTDIGGYFIGKIFKGPKLTKISPNKTISGVFGSYIFSFLAIYILIFVFEIQIYKDKIILALFFTFLISTISQVGDIMISYFKRLSNKKDTGNLIPGHGGLLDRIDGMIFAYPFTYLLIFLNFLKLWNQ